MQTFLPYADFELVAKCLDFRRLGKQRVEAFQILNTLQAIKENRRVGWMNHPAVKMWQGYEDCLKVYYNIMVQEWVCRGYRNQMKVYEIDYNNIVKPVWLGHEALHSSHRANLLRKLPEYYKKFGWSEEPQQGYWWPYRREKDCWICCLQ